MRTKNRLLGIAAAMGLMLSMSICAGAADYHFERSQGAEYYSATSYESVYGAQYRVGGANAVDYQWPELPYGTTGGTGCMEKVYLPAGTILSGTGDVGGIPSDIWSEEAPASSLWQTAFTDAGTMTRKDGSIGTLAIPSLGIQMRVWEGETNQSMAKGLGHYRSTSGWDGNVGICGHNRGAKYVIGTIKDLKVGDVITFDNRSIVDEQGNFRTMPILADWYEVLREAPETRHLAVVLARYVTGSAAAMGQRNEIDLDNRYIVLDTSGLSDDLLLPGIFWATDVAYDLILGAERELSALIADELWALVGAGPNPLVANFIVEMVKTIRGLGGIAVTSTQGMQDLFSLDGGKYGKGILDSSRIKLIMQMEEQEARLIQGVLNLSEDEVRQITRFRRGEGLLCIGYNHVPIAFHASKREYDAITTSSTDLRRDRGDMGE